MNIKNSYIKVDGKQTNVTELSNDLKVRVTDIQFNYDKENQTKRVHHLVQNSLSISLVT
jgi:hypothetical protein